MPTSRMVVPEGLTHRAVILPSPRIVLSPGTVRERLATQWYTEHIEHSELDMLSQVLTPLAAAYLPGLDMEALAHVALGGLYGAALYIARSAEPVTARAQADAVLDTLITGLRSGTSAATTGPPRHKEPAPPRP